MLTSSDFSGLLNERFFRNFFPISTWTELITLTEPRVY